MTERYKGKPSGNVAENNKDVGKQNQVNEQPQVPGAQKKTPGGTSHQPKSDEKIDELGVTRGQNGEKGNTTDKRNLERREEEPAH